MNTIRYTSFWDRFLAGFIDGLVFLPLGFLEAPLIMASPTPSVLFLISVFNAIIFYSYSVLMHYHYGQTLGKKAMSIKIIHANEEDMEISLRQAFIRECVPIFLEASLLFIALFSLLSTNTFSDEYLDYPAFIWFIVEVITMLSNEKRRAAHDFMANTVVIKTA